MMAGQQLRVRAHGASDRGRVRQGNEDSYFVGTTVFAVADGMGGHVAGEVASETALRPLTELDGRQFAVPEDADEALVDALRAANASVVAKAEEDPSYRGMGTTLTAVMVRDGRLHVAHVGDSRAYLLRPGERISQLTTDHTLVERLIQEGRLSRDEAAHHPQRNVITRAIGHEPQVQVDSLPPLQLQPGDQVLLCSDGLTGPVPDATIADILIAARDGDEGVRRLIAAANDAGGPDNITVVLLRVEPGGSQGGTSPPLEPGGSQGGTAGAPEEHVHRIRTRHERSDTDWARQMGRLGAPQGVERRPVAQPRTGRLRRVLAALLAVVVLLGIVIGGGYFLLSRAYFVGDHNGQVAVYRGLPQDVAGIPLYRLVDGEVSDLRLSDFPAWRQERIREGISAATLSEARSIVRSLAASLEEEQPAASPRASPSPAPPSPAPQT